MKQNNILGVIDSLTTKIGDEPNCLYYEDGKLTDQYYIINARTQSNKCWVYGAVNKGDYLTTSTWYGVAIKAPNKDVSFGIALSSKSSFIENESPWIDLVEFEYINAENR